LEIRIRLELKIADGSVSSIQKISALHLLADYQGQTRTIHGKINDLAHDFSMSNAF